MMLPKNFSMMRKGEHSKAEPSWNCVNQRALSSLCSRRTDASLAAADAGFKIARRTLTLRLISILRLTRRMNSGRHTTTESQSLVEVIPHRWENGESAIVSSAPPGSTPPQQQHNHSQQQELHVQPLLSK